MASNIFLTLGERTVMVARPATYQNLQREIRTQFPRVSSVYSLAVLFQPANINGGLLSNWVEVDASAYSAVHNGAELFVNVVHPLTKEYILPLPGLPVPNRQHRKQVRRTDGLGNRVGVEDGDHDATAQSDQVSKSRPRGVSTRTRGSSHKFDNFSLSLELEQPGGDAFGSGWAAASERFRRSTKLLPNLKDCKEAIGQSVGESNFYPEDEEEQTADFKLGLQRPQATEAGWYAGAEPTHGDENPGETAAQHLAGGDEDEDEVAGPGDHTEAGHLTNGVQANGENTNGVLANGVTTNGNLTNGHAAAHSEVSHSLQHKLQHHGASEWSPPRPRSNGYHRPQYPEIQGYHPYGQPNFKAFAGSRPRRDPAEITYGSPRPRIQGDTSGWATMGRKKKTWANQPVQEESDREGAPGPNANNNQAWYAQPPPPINFSRTLGHGGGTKHRGFARHGSNNYQQKQRSGPEMSWGSDFWGGAPPNRTQRGAFAQDETPASKHWQ
ncbi:hypothetical protein INS49_003717 [Diaporthe citri]|uniref:uncharacterized protein n=1 Tax=Diaporthe citri TaxID=83186 RepID=UPI001C80BAFE|nr:uncharacterized protein INS49_003717 [Diaporthe citri]KAG6355751.1 hypothetical protein INS49_003717 [Diaporthe citri]